MVSNKYLKTSAVFQCVQTNTDINDCIHSKLSCSLMKSIDYLTIGVITL